MTTHAQCGALWLAPRVRIALTLLIGGLLITGCTPLMSPPSPTPSPVPAEEAGPSSTAPSESILTPESWELVPGETVLQARSGSEPSGIDIPMDGAGKTYVMYAMCSSTEGLSVEAIGMRNGEEYVVSEWDVTCDEVPSRRTNYTDEASATHLLRLSTEGTGAWGFVLADAA